MNSNEVSPMAHHALKVEHYDIDEEQAQAIEQAILGRPFDILGPNFYSDKAYLCTLQPGAKGVTAIDPQGRTLTKLEASAHSENIFVGVIAADAVYRLRIDWGTSTQEIDDPYRFAPQLGELDRHLINEGKHFKLNHVLGAHVRSVDGVSGVSFAVWAPNARRVSVVGAFNQWDGRRHPMFKHEKSGLWEIFIPGLEAGCLYKYEILSGFNEVLPLKADPVGWQSEARPGDASVVPSPIDYRWDDEQWMATREAHSQRQSPISIYEVHATSWRRREEDNNRPLNWNELGDELIPYVQELGFTHIELLPVSAHPFGGSWGYQPVGLFAPLPECGTPEMFSRFIDRCHQAGIGVIIDWVPAHFPTDPHGLMRFDGTALYEHEDAREGFHQDWNTLIYNLGRHEVRGFLLANALHWLETYHIDGLRVDAVASMLYRDYSRAADQWIPNIYGGRENLEAIEFLRQLNSVVTDRVPGALVIAEESTAWPGVTQEVSEGGLGFAYKWNMGWMHDTLQYIQKDPVYRRYHHGEITFCLHYAFSEKFVLPLSHDEVVHGKGSMIGKMPGDQWQQFANLRAYYGLMWAHPGKKLLFMGSELGQYAEWNHDAQLDWPALEFPLHKGVQQFIGDLNRLYREQPALHSADCDTRGFVWLVGDDAENSVFAFYRAGVDKAAPPVVVVCNLTPLPQENYRLGMPRIGRWKEAINSDAACYGGSNMGNGGAIVARPESSHWQAFSAEITLPPLSTLFFVYDEEQRGPEVLRELSQ